MGCAEIRDPGNAGSVIRAAVLKALSLRPPRRSASTLPRTFFVKGSQISAVSNSLGDP